MSIDLSDDLSITYTALEMSVEVADYNLREYSPC